MISSTDIQVRRGNDMHLFFIKILGWAMLLTLVAFGVSARESAAPADYWLINTGEHGEQDKLTVYPAWIQLVQQLAAVAKTGQTTHFSNSTTQDLFATRGGTVNFIVGPAHIVGSALRHGHYALIAAADRRQRVVLAALAGSGIHSLADARGKSLGLPSQDAIATYLMRGESNAAGVSLKQHFSRIYYTHYEGALLNALKFRTVDTVAVDAALFAQWQAAGEPVVEVIRTGEIPGIAIVAHKSLGKATIAKLQEMVAGKRMPVPAQAGVRFRFLEPDAYEYVATLGYFTPRILAGAELIDAQRARRLASRGVAFFDGRTEEEFRTGRPAGSRWLPYVEHSAKETDYDAGPDQFDIAQLPANKDAEIIFSCGGPECWKSYKSAIRAMKEGYTRIYWFRGGIKEWAEAGLPIDKD